VKKLLGKVILGVAAGVAIYVGFSIWADARSVGRALAEFHWHIALVALGLASLNYLVRFARWHYYLKVLGLSVPAGHSLLVFLGGFSLTVTPGKLGEVVKALLLRESHGIAAARTAPIVIAERFTDLMGLLLLACVGIFTFKIDPRFLLIGAGLIVAGLLTKSGAQADTRYLEFAPQAIYFVPLRLDTEQRLELSVGDTMMSLPDVRPGTTTAPRASSKRAAATWPLRATVMSNVSPSLPTALGSPPASRSRSSNSASPLMAARCNGVTP